jgi:hypothetical protein
MMVSPLVNGSRAPKRGWCNVQTGKESRRGLKRQEKQKVNTRGLGGHEEDNLARSKTNKFNYKDVDNYELITEVVKPSTE